MKAYPVLETVKEGGATFKVYDPEHYKIARSMYAFPFDYVDKSPKAIKNHGQSLGRIEWIIEPRKFEYDKSIKRYYIKEVYLFAKQTRDDRYSDKTFSMKCYTQCISGSILERNKHQEIDAMKCAWRITPALITKTLMFETYPPINFNFLILNLESSLGADIKFIKYSPADESDWIYNHADYKKKLTKLLNEKHGWT